MIGWADGRVLHGVLVVSGASIAVFLLSPTGSVPRIGAWFVPLVLAAVLLSARLRHVRRAARLPLLLLLAGHLLYVAASAVWYIGAFLLAYQPPFPSPVDGLHFVAHGFMALFLLVVLRRRLRHCIAGSRIALIDSSVLTISISTMLWAWVIEPQLGSGATTGETAVAVLYPVTSLVLVGLAARLGLSAGFTRSVSALLLLVWVGAEVGADLWYGTEGANQTFAYDEPFMVAWMVSAAALAALTAHHGFSRMLLGGEGRPDERRSPAGVRSSTTARLTVLVLAALVPLVIEAFDDHRGQTLDMFFLLGASVTMFVLVVYRSALLAGDLEQQHLLTRRLDEALERVSSQRDELARYGAIVGSTDDAIAILSLDGVVLDWNPGAERLLGYTREEVVGQPATVVAAVDDPELFSATMGRAAELGHVMVESVERHKDGSTVQMSVGVSGVHDETGAIVAYVAICRDIGASKARDAALHQDSKLESLGRLSAGLAHEINTPIQYVGDNARFLEEAYQELIRVVEVYRALLDTSNPIGWAERQERVRETEASIDFEYLEKEIPSAVEQTLEGINRVSTIVRAMKTFSHPGHQEQVPADLNEALAATVTVTRHQVGDVADLTMDLGQLPPVRCNPADLNQVFLNLIVNAADAIEETGRRGAIAVTTAVDGEDVVIGISDTGGGIPDDIRAKIFEPFFTTKDVGRGTGQGLPLARAVVHEGHGGTLSVSSVTGKGSTFTIRLPVYGRTAIEPAPVAG